MKTETCKRDEMKGVKGEPQNQQRMGPCLTCDDMIFRYIKCDDMIFKIITRGVIY